MTSKLRKKASTPALANPSLEESVQTNPQNLTILKEIENCLSLNQKIMERMDGLGAGDDKFDSRCRHSSKKAFKSSSKKRLAPTPNPNFRAVHVEPTDFIRRNAEPLDRDSTNKKSKKKCAFFAGQDPDSLLVQAASPQRSSSKPLEKSHGSLQARSHFHSNCHHRCHRKSTPKSRPDSTGKTEARQSAQPRQPKPTHSNASVATASAHEKTLSDSLAPTKLSRNLFHHEHINHSLAEKFTRKYREPREPKVLLSKASLNDTAFPANGLSLDYAYKYKPTTPSQMRLDTAAREKIASAATPRECGPSDRAPRPDPRLALKSVTNRLAHFEHRSCAGQDPDPDKSLCSSTSAAVQLDSHKSYQKFASVDITKDLITKLLQEKSKKAQTEVSSHLRHNSSVLGKLSANESFGPGKQPCVSGKEKASRLPTHLALVHGRQAASPLEVYKAKETPSPHNAHLSLTRTGTCARSLNRSRDQSVSLGAHTACTPLNPLQPVAANSPHPVPNISINLSAKDNDISVIHIDSSDPKHLQIKLERKENRPPTPRDDYKLDGNLLKSQLKNIQLKNPFSKATMIRPRKQNPQRARESHAEEQFELDRSESKSEWEHIQTNINKQFKQLEDRYLQHK